MKICDLILENSLQNLVPADWSRESSGSRIWKNTNLQGNSIEWQPASNFQQTPPGGAVSGPACLLSAFQPRTWLVAIGRRPPWVHPCDTQIPGWGDRWHWDWLPNWEAWGYKYKTNSSRKILLLSYNVGLYFFALSLSRPL